MNIPKREEGQGLVEYALVLVLIALAVLVILTLLGSAVVVTYARVIGGLTGQSVTMSGSEYIIINADVQVSGGGMSCSISSSNARVVVLNDGALQEEGSVNVTYTVNEIAHNSTVTIDSSGISDLSFSSGSTGCPIVIENSHGYHQVFNP